MSHGEGSKRLASPRNTKDRKHLQSTQSAQPTHLTDQAPSTTERTARETHNINYHSSRARFSTATTHHHHPHPTGSSPKPFSQRSPLRSPGAIQAGCLSRRAEPHNTLDPTRLSGDTQRPPPPPPAWGGPSSGVADGQPRAHGVLLSKGRGRGGGGRGRAGSFVGWRSLGLIAGVSCLLCFSAVPGVWSFLRVTHLRTHLRCTTTHCATDIHLRVVTT